MSYSEKDIIEKAKSFIHNESKFKISGDLLYFERNKKEFEEQFMSRAWKDSMMYVRRFTQIDKESLNVLEKICREKCKKFLLKQELSGYIEAYKEIENEWKSRYHIDSTSEQNPLEYVLGIWQKFSSMTFKYLYCIQISSEGMVKWLEEKEFEKVKSPIDSYIARSIFKISPMTKEGEETRKIAWHIATSTKLDGKSCCWSKISEEQYRILEEAIRNFCDTQRVGSRFMIPLEFDLLFWEAL